MAWNETYNHFTSSVTFLDAQRYSESYKSSKMVLEGQEQPTEVVLKMFNKVVVLKMFNKVSGLKAGSIIEKRIQRRCFPVNIAKYLRTTILKNIRYRA